MLSTRIILPLITFLVAVAIALTTLLLPLIPSWSTFQTITSCFAIAASLAAAVWLTRGIWLQTKERLKEAFRVVLTLASGFLMAFGVFVIAMLWIFEQSGGLFSPIYHHEVAFPEYETTIYVYDTSFLDAETRFTVRRGWLPLMEEIGTNRIDPASAELVQEGEWVVGDGFRLHLPTGRVERTDEMFTP